MLIALFLSSVVEGQALECFQGVGQVLEGRVINSSLQSGRCFGSNLLCYRRLSTAAVIGVSGKQKETTHAIFRSLFCPQNKQSEK